MPNTQATYRVFIASPSGLEDERKAFAAEVDQYNRLEANHRGIHYVAVGWENTLPGIGRPQSLINEDLKACDYFVLVLHDRWGSAPSNDPQHPFSSGTQEEFETAKQLNGQPSCSIRQIVILFKDVDPLRTRDPGAELKRVLDFRKSLEDEKKFLFSTFQSLDAFRQSVRAQLGDWVRQHERQTETASELEGIPEELVTLAETIAAKSDAQTREMRAELAAHKQEIARLASALNRLSTAARGGTPKAKKALGRAWQQQDVGAAAELIEQQLSLSSKVISSNFNRSTLLHDALAYAKTNGNSQQIVDYCKELIWLDPADRTVWISRADAHLTLAQLDDARRSYEEVISRGKDEDSLDASAHCGLARVYHCVMNMHSASTHVERSLHIALRLNDPDAAGQAYNEMGLQAMAAAEQELGERRFRQAIDVARESNDPYGYAGYLNNLGTLYVQFMQYDDADPLFAESLEIGKQIGNNRIIASAAANVASSFLRKGKVAEAKSRFSIASRAFKKLRAADALYYDALIDGSIFSHQGRLNEAISAQHRAVQHALRHSLLEEAVEAELELAKFLIERLELDEVSKIVDRCIRRCIVPGNEKNLVEVYLVKCEMHLAAREWQLAADSLQKIAPLRIMPLEAATAEWFRVESKWGESPVAETLASMRAAADALYRSGFLKLGLEATYRVAAMLFQDGKLDEVVRILESVYSKSLEAGLFSVSEVSKWGLGACVTSSSVHPGQSIEAARAALSQRGYERRIRECEAVWSGSTGLAAR